MTALGGISIFFSNDTNHLGVVKRTLDCKLEGLSLRPPLASQVSYHFLFCKIRRVYQIASSSKFCIYGTLDKYSEDYLEAFCSGF